jgi:hypothetical protein
VGGCRAGGITAVKSGLARQVTPLVRAGLNFIL